MKWTTTNQSVEHGVKILVYGAAGSGKTKLCATMPNPIIASAESGLLVLRGSSIPVAIIKTLADLYEFYRWVSGSQEARQFQSVCIDSVSEIAEVLLQAEKSIAKDPRQAYGELITKMEQLTRAFRDLPGFHVYIAAKMEYAKDDTGRMFYGPMMPGSKLGQALPYFFDEVFHLGVGEYEGKIHRYLLTGKTAQFEAKDRSGALALYEPPDLGLIIRKITTGA